jgi:hypothetical protein
MLAIPSHTPAYEHSQQASILNHNLTARSRTFSRYLPIQSPCWTSRHTSLPSSSVDPRSMHYDPLHSALSSIMHIISAHLFGRLPSKSHHRLFFLKPSLMTSFCRFLGSGALSSLGIRLLGIAYGVRNFRRVRTCSNLPENNPPR